MLQHFYTYRDIILESILVRLFLILQVIYHDSVLLGVHDPVFPDAGSAVLE